MKNTIRKIIILATVVLSIFSWSQVGINTTTPTATLDVNGNLKIRKISEILSMPGYQLMVVKEDGNEVLKIDPQIIENNIEDNIEDEMEDILNTDGSVYFAKKSGGITLLGLALFSNWKQINFTSTDRVVGASSLFSASDYSYIAPSAGVYKVSFYFRYGNGLQIGLLSGSPGIGVIKNSGGNFTVLDTRQFSGVNLGVVSFTKSESQIDLLCSLKVGDKLYFGIIDSSFLSTNVLGSSGGTFSVNKVSN